MGNSVYGAEEPHVDLSHGHRVARGPFHEGQKVDDSKAVDDARLEQGRERVDAFRSDAMPRKERPLDEVDQRVDKVFPGLARSAR